MLYWGNVVSNCRLVIGPKTVSMTACAALKSLQIRHISQSITRTFVLGSVASRHGIYFPPSSRHYKAVMSSQNRIYFITLGLQRSGSNSCLLRSFQLFFTSSHERSLSSCFLNTIQMSLYQFFRRAFRMSHQ